MGVSEMEAGSVISVDFTFLASSVVEAWAVGTVLSTAVYFSRLLSVIGSVLDEGWSQRMSTTDERFPFNKLRETKQEALKNEDAIETDEDDEDEGDEANDDDDDADDEDFSAEEEGEEEDPKDNLQANGEGGGEEEDDDEEDDDDDEEKEEDEEEEEEEDEEDVPQPPSKKRK